MTGNHHSTPDPYHAKPGLAGPDPIGRWSDSAGDRPQVNRFDRIERHIRQLMWLVGINLALSAALLVALILEG